MARSLPQILISFFFFQIVLGVVIPRDSSISNPDSSGISPSDVDGFPHPHPHWNGTDGAGRNISSSPEGPFTLSANHTRISHSFTPTHSFAVTSLASPTFSSSTDEIQRDSGNENDNPFSQSPHPVFNATHSLHEPHSNATHTRGGNAWPTADPSHTLNIDSPWNASRTQTPTTGIESASFD